MTGGIIRPKTRNLDPQSIPHCCGTDNKKRGWVSTPIFFSILYYTQKYPKVKRFFQRDNPNLHFIFFLV
ncbi:hypothetical protein AGMMS50249_4070 [candidate division SR1 bacterium]|nr:hypothetical protein AGMMS50249_4070 [candidate division SR1 bacterium]